MDARSPQSTLVANALAPLYRHCVVHSDERVHSHRCIAEALSDYGLEWRGGKVKTDVFQLSSSDLSLFSMQYGDEVLIRPNMYQDFSLVHFSIQHGIEVLAHGCKADVPQGSVLLSSPRKSIQLRWQEGCEQIILRVPHSLLSRVAPHAARGRTSATLHLPSQLRLPAQVVPIWYQLIQSYAQYVDFAQTQEHLAPWLAHVEQAMAMLLLAQLPGGAIVQAINDMSPTMAGTSHRRLARLEAHVFARLESPLSLHDLARAAALSPRQLNALTQQHWGVAPMVWLRQQRLAAAHQVLQSTAGADVTSCALRFGFSNVGRFAAYYQKIFGEKPHETVRRQL